MSIISKQKLWFGYMGNNRIFLILLLAGLMGACQFQKSASIIKLPEIQQLSPIHFERHQKGIARMAFGNEPFWAVEVGADSLFYRTPHFRQPLGFEVVRQTDAFVFAQRAGVALAIYFHQDSCSDQMSDQLHPLTTTLFWMPEDGDSTLFPGCGKKLYNPALHGHWDLKEIQAFFSFDVHNGRAYFQQPHHTDTLLFENYGSKISFKIHQTNKATDFAHQLEKITDYQIINGKNLLLLQENEPVFKGTRMPLPQVVQ